MLVEEGGCRVMGKGGLGMDSWLGEGKGRAVGRYE